MIGAARAALPDHLAPLDGGWAMWRWVGLRGAGLPLERVLALASPACAAAADRCLDAEGTARAQAAAAELDRAVEAATARAAAALEEVARDGSFREALAWQNRRALHSGVDQLCRPATGGRNKKRRAYEAMVARYLQRYCAKNESIGFFGPVGWARAVDEGPLLAVQPGPSLLATRTAYLEGWGVDALCERLAADGALLPWLAPRRMPYAGVEGTALRLPMAPPVRVTPAEAAALQACDGERSAREVAALLLADPALGLAGEDEAFGVLRRLRDARWIAWTLEVPADDLHPEAALRRRLERVGEERLRVPALAALDELEEARRAVAAAAGDAAAVDDAVAGLEATFVRLTAAAPTRRDGETYAGRTLVYEDCRRDVDVRLGPELSRTLGPPLSLVLDAARWLTAEAGRVYRAALRRAYADLARRAGPVLPFASLWYRAHPLIFGEESMVPLLTGRLRDRWATVLTIPGAERRVVFDVEELRPRVRAAFATDGRGWRSARYHTPDVVIAAASAEAAAAGRFQYVLGEVHPAVNTLNLKLFLAQHPALDELLRAAARDLPDPQVVAVNGRARGGGTARTSRGLVTPKDYRLVFATDTCGVPPGRALPIGSLEVVEAGDGLEVRTRGGGLRFDVMDVLSDLLSLELLHAFEIAPAADHVPRISFDRLVVCRETWWFARDEVGFARARTERDRFLEARRWTRAHGIPRFAFVRAADDEKPIFVDFDSPALVNVLARNLSAPASGQRVKVTEMLPGPDEAWLVDSRGRRYTSELRIVTLERGD